MNDAGTSAAARALSQPLRDRGLLIFARRYLVRPRPWLAAALIAGACVLAFWPGMQASLHLDDYDMLRTNGLAARSVADLVRLYPTRWLVVLTLWVNARLHGEAVWGYHLVSLVLHVLNAWLVCVLTWRCWWYARRRRWRVRGIRPHWFGVMVACVFALHPLQTQAVVYITQRFTLAAALWYFLAVLAVANAYRPGRARWRGWLGAGLATAVGALCKEIIITAPLLALSFVWCWVAPPAWRRWRARTWLLALVLALMAVGAAALYFLHLSQWDARTARRNFEAVGAPITLHYQALTRWTYALTQPSVVARYLGLLAWPRGLNVDHDVRIRTVWYEPAVWVPCAAFALALWLAWRGRRVLPWCWWGALFFFIPLVPQSSLIPSPDPMFEHRVYISTAGFAWCAGGLLCWALTRVHWRWLRIAAYGAVAVYMLALLLATRARCRVWHDELTLWQDAYRLAPRKQRVVINYASALFERGRVDETIACLITFMQTSTAVLPHASALLGTAFAARGETEAALRCYAEAVAAQPANDQLRYNYAALLHAAGHTTEALMQADCTISFNPWNADAWYLAGALRAAVRGEETRATNCFTQYLRLQPAGPHAEVARAELARLTAVLAGAGATNSNAGQP